MESDNQDSGLSFNCKIENKINCCIGKIRQIAELSSIMTLLNENGAMILKGVRHLSLIKSHLSVPTPKLPTTFKIVFFGCCRTAAALDICHGTRPGKKETSQQPFIPDKHL